jgi:hypothetical protein
MVAATAQYFSSERSIAFLAFVASTSPVSTKCMAMRRNVQGGRGSCSELISTSTERRS